MSEKDYDTMLKEVLPWLEYGDRKELASELGVTRDYVTRCLTGRYRSWKVLRAAAEKATKNKTASTRARDELKRIGA